MNFTPSNSKPNYYSILGVAINAEDVVIRAAYRALVQRYHPDKGPGYEQGERAERILAIQKAYQVLCDPTLRRQHDLDLGKQAFEFKGNFKDWESTEESKSGIKQDVNLAQNWGAQSWDALLHTYPQLQAHYLRLLKTDPIIALEYKTFLIEFVAERMVARTVERITSVPGKSIDI